MPDVNWWAVLVAAASAFVLGGIWYGPLFKAAWCREAGIDIAATPRHPAAVFGGAFVLSLVAAWALAAVIGRSADVSIGFAVHVGLLTGLCFVATSFGINYLFAGRSLKLWLIDAGYHVLQFTLYGLILGAWR